MKPATRKLPLPAKYIGSLILPLIGLIIISGFLLVDQYRSYQKTRKMESLIHISIQFGNLIHMIQKERGLSAGFLSGGNASFRKRLDEERKRTQKQVGSLQTLIDTSFIDRDNDLFHFSLILEQLAKITVCQQ